MSARSSAAWARMLCVPLAGLVALLLLWPGALLVQESLRSGSDGNGLTLSQYARIVLEPKRLRALGWSLGLSAAVAVISTGLCLAPAWMLAHGRFRGKSGLRAVYALPLSFAGVIVGFLMVVMLGRAGFVPHWARRLTGTAWLSSAAYQFGGILLAYLYFEIPRATLTLEAALRRFDLRLVAAARSLGASRRQAWFYVVLPALAPALLSTVAVTFSVSLGSFGVVLILSTRGLSVLPLEIFMAYLAFPFDPHGAAAMSTVLIALAFLANYGVRTGLDGPRRRAAPAHSGSAMGTASSAAEVRHAAA
jgi:putative spermidine/putrescine transport system permease protein